MQLPLDTSLMLLYYIDYRDRPQLLPATNNLIFKLSKNALLEHYPRTTRLINSISRYAVRNLQYQFAVDILESIYENSEHISIEEELYTLKKLGFFYNKIGEFGISLEIFENGLQKAEKANLDKFKMDFYHHLSHEYKYLSMIDSSYHKEVKRLEKKCHEYALKTKDSMAIAQQTIMQSDQNFSIADLQRQKNKALSMLNPDYIEYWSSIENIQLQYLEALFNNHHYQQYISESTKMLDSLNYMRDLHLTARLTQCYIQTQNLEKAREFARRTKELYQQNPDQDIRRQLLIWTPEIFEKLGFLEEAYYFAEERNISMQKQITNKRRLNDERQRFDRELGHEIDKSEKQKAKNEYLTAGLLMLAGVFTVTAFSVRALRSKNQIINESLHELELVNHNLNLANKDLESFAYASAHDIKSPLSTISGFIQLVKLDDDSALSQDTHEYIQAIDTSITDVNTLITSILKYAKLGNEELRLKEIDFNEKIEKVKLLLHQQIIDKQATVNIAPELASTMGEPELLQQLILNLMSNAIKYSRPEEPPVLDITSSQDTQNVYIHFRDNGIGIPEENIQKVFSLFGRADNSKDYDGVGVGLAVCAKIVKMHRGILSVTNNKYHGATFTLQLPRLSAQAQQIREAFIQTN